MKMSGSVVWRRTLVPVFVLASGFATARAAAQDAFSFDWRATAVVNRSTDGGAPDRATHYQRSGTSALTIVRDPTRDVRFAFDFSGPDGSGSGLVPRSAEQVVDPNFAYPSPLPPDLPAAQTRATHGSFQRLADGAIPAAFQIVYIEQFVCRTRLVDCGGVSSWEVVFVGHARSTVPSPR